MVAADVVVTLHMAFLTYLVLGGFLALRRFALIWPHIGVLIWSVGVTATGFTCPLTSLEKWLLERGGAPAYEGSFIEHYLHGTLFPGQYEVAVGLGAWAIALVSYAVVLMRRRRPALVEPA
jgi:hypothetical protein